MKSNHTHVDSSVNSRGFRPQWYSHFLCQVQAAIRSSGSSNTALSEGVEASVIYVRFKAAASEVTVFLVFELKLFYEQKTYLQITSYCSERVRAQQNAQIPLNSYWDLWCENFCTLQFHLSRSFVEAAWDSMFLQLKPVLEEIESRSSRKEYVELLAECHRLYCEQRLSLVSFNWLFWIWPPIISVIWSVGL